MILWTDFSDRPEDVPWTEFDRGGRFAAMEQAGLLIADGVTFFRRFR